MPPSVKSNCCDLWQTVSDDASGKQLDVVLLSGDNGPDFAPDVAVIQHVIARMWRKFRWCMVTAGCQLRANGLLRIASCEASASVELRIAVSTTLSHSIRLSMVLTLLTPRRPTRRPCVQSPSKL